MADDHTDSDAAFALLADDDETQELSKAIIILNKNVAALTNSVQTMGEYPLPADSFVIVKLICSRNFC